MEKRLLFYMLLIAQIFFSGSEIFATHIVGGDITYKCLGNNKFEISLTVRRDCLNGSPGAQFDDPAFVGIFSGSGTLRSDLASSGILRMNFRPDDTLNEVISNNCGLVGGDICVHTTTYKDTLTLPYSVDGYILAYQRCCRNYTISNIIDPLTVGSTFTIRIFEAALSVCNSSPLLNKWPPIYVCSNSPLQFNLSATDAEGDSLVYELCNPLTGADQNIPRPNIPSYPPYDPVLFKSPFSIQDMIGGTPSLTMGRFSGLMSGFVQPTITQYLIAYCVKEYRNGILLTELQREFQINVRTCVSNAIALFDYQIQDCESPLSIQFNNKSVSPNSTLKSIQWIFDQGGMISTSTDQNPKISVMDSGSINVKLIAISKEGCSDTTNKNIIFQNIKPKVFSDTLKICKGDSVELIQSYVKGIEYSWSPYLGLDCSNCPNPKASPVKDQWYYLVSKSIHCQRIDSIFVKVNPCVIDTCAISVNERCLAGGILEITIVDAFGKPILPSTRNHELFWNIKSSPTQTSYSIRNKNPIQLANGTEFSITSKIYSWKVGSPKTIEYADICERRIQYKAKKDCIGPCNDLQFILSSCLDTYHEDNHLNYPTAICESICKNECKFIVALFEKNGQLVNPSEYIIKWSTGSSAAYVELMVPYYNTLTVEVRKGDCVWYGRYIRSCKNKLRSETENAIQSIDKRFSIANTSKIKSHTANTFRNDEHEICENNYVIFPNPITDLTNILYIGDQRTIQVHLEIYDVTGNLKVSNDPFTLEKGVLHLLQISDLEQGLYTLIIRVGQKSFVKRIIKLD